MSTALTVLASTYLTLSIVGIALALPGITRALRDPKFDCALPLKVGIAAVGVVAVAIWPFGVFRDKANGR